MKKHIRVFIALMFLIILFGGCKKDNVHSNAPVSPFQGPHNPSFETSGLDSIYSWNSQSYMYFNDGAYWNAAGGELFAEYQRLSGTGFLPSQGQYYASLTNFSNNGASSANEQQVSFYQDSVDLSHSHTMTFDYTLSSGSPYFSPACFGPCTYTYFTSITAQILFTSNGTVTLWQQTINGTSTWTSGAGAAWHTTTVPAAPIQTLSQSITLPTLTAPGRLRFQITATAIDSVGNVSSPQYYPLGTFGIDNIRVQ